MLAWSGLFGSSHAYFDARGALMGAYETSDAAQTCAGKMSFATTYGTVPACTMSDVRSLCP